MTNKEAIEIVSGIRDSFQEDCFNEIEALDLAIKALERDAKVDDITAHWNDKENGFISACVAFEDILKLYDRGVAK